MSNDRDTAAKALKIGKAWELVCKFDRLIGDAGIFDAEVIKAIDVLITFCNREAAKIKDSSER